MISIDRLIAVKWPLRYISLNLKYSYFIALGLAIYVLMAFAFFVYSSYTQDYVVRCLSSTQYQELDVNLRVTF